MFKKVLALVCVAAMFAVTGCIDATTVVKVKKDGSGVIVESVYFGKGFIKMMEQMTAQMGAAMGGGAPAASSPVNKPFDPPLEVEKYKSKAPQMGEGVTYQSSKKVQRSDGSPGIQIVYAFTDINKVKMSSQPDMGGPQGSGMNEAQEAKDPITFKMAKEGKPKLVIMMPKPDLSKNTAEPAEAKTPEMPPEQMKEMKQMFEGMRMRMVVMVDGKITKSNATYQEKDKDGNSHIVTLFDMNLGKLINDDAGFKKLTAMGNIQDMATAKEKLKGIDGIRIETNEKIDVEFE